MLLSSHVDTLHFMPGINNQPNKASSKASFHIYFHHLNYTGVNLLLDTIGDWGGLFLGS